MVDNITDKELLQKNVEEFSRLQSYMILSEKDSNVYKAMKIRYIELKVILTASGINLTELDIIQEQEHKRQKVRKIVFSVFFRFHNNKFHPDDVFSTVFLSKYIENPVLYRTNVGEVDAPNAIVYDVGFGKFDHHGIDAKYRPNSKLKYCSFGLLWTEYGKDYLTKNNYEYIGELYTAIEEKLVKQIDGIDNGIFPSIKAEYSLLDLDHIIDLFNPTWEEQEVDTDINFMKAYETATIIFDNFKVIDN